MSVQSQLILHRSEQCTDVPDQSRMTFSFVLSDGSGLLNPPYIHNFLSDHGILPHTVYQRSNNRSLRPNATQDGRLTFLFMYCLACLRLFVLTADNLAEPSFTSFPLELSNPLETKQSTVSTKLLKKKDSRLN